LFSIAVEVSAKWRRSS